MRNKKMTVWLMGGLLLALSVFGTAAQNGTRVPPEGDSFVTPALVLLNGSKTITGVEGATLQGSSIEETTCDPNDDSTHSVWFGFTLPTGVVGFFDFDTAGSWYYSENFGSQAMVVSVYSFSSPTLTQVDCRAGPTPRISNLNLDGGDYRVRVAYTSANALTGPSQARLSIRVVRILYGLIEDPGFNSHPLGVHWKVKKAGDPPKVTRVCSLGCLVRFGGVAKGQLSQTVTFDPAILKFKKGDVMQGNVFVSDTPADGSDVKVTLQITYSNGTPATKVSITRHITQPSTSISTNFGFMYAEIANKTVKSIKFTVSSPQADDLFSIDSTNLVMQAGTNVRAEPLPLPPAP